MTLIKYTPRRSTLALADDMNAVFNRLWPRNYWADTPARDWSPAFDIRETKDELVFDAALPGLNKKDIEVTVHDGVLTVTGEHTSRDTKDDETVYYSELLRGRFSRSFSLPTNVDEEKIEAKYRDGILTISLKKVEPVEPEKNRIAVK
ncbi:MAG: Hsp20/alpha crystallin family protein [Candidatus Marinimicrobia bacterium]|nr:Hsp20/alpha crystallin family protein [Candidatus Neomarinimicrobiota bacterium]